MGQGEKLWPPFTSEKDNCSVGAERGIMIMKKTEVTNLSRPYISVNNSFGGNQSWFENIEKTHKGKTIKNYGCGLIGGSDILLYLTKGAAGREFGMKNLSNEAVKSAGVSSSGVSSESYMDYILNMEKKYFHILPWFGISGILLAWNMNMYFLLHGKEIIKLRGHNYHARWCVMPHNLLKKIKEMLSNDIPVVIAIGPGFFRKNKIIFYGKNEQKDGKIIFKPLTKTKDHYVTITGVTEYKTTDKNLQDGFETVNEKKSLSETVTYDNIVMLEISSWGKKYYINFQEYLDYVKKNDNYYFSNILYIKPVGKHK